MTPARKKRLSLIIVLVVGVGVAVGLVLKAMNENVMFFFSPTQVLAGEAPKDRPFRIGGLVVKGSVKRDPNSVVVHFDLTDSDKIVTIEYAGILPDLFREGQGIIANGRLNAKGMVVADEVLAKHDENYMPPEVHDAMKTAEMSKQAAADKAKADQAAGTNSATQPAPSQEK